MLVALSFFYGLLATAALALLLPRLGVYRKSESLRRWGNWVASLAGGLLLLQIAGCVLLGVGYLPSQTQWPHELTTMVEASLHFTAPRSSRLPSFMPPVDLTPDTGAETGITTC